MTNQNIPPSLAVKPNIAWENQTIEQLELEYQYWNDRVESAPGFASASVADSFRRACKSWINRKLAEKKNDPTS